MPLIHDGQNRTTERRLIFLYQQVLTTRQYFWAEEYESEFERIASRVVTPPTMFAKLSHTPVIVFEGINVSANFASHTALIAPTFADLVPDVMSRDQHNRSMASQRQRRFGACDMKYDRRDGSWRIVQWEENAAFTQNVSDARNTTRRFAPLRPHVRDSPFLSQLLAYVTQLAFLSGNVTHSCTRATVHQIRQCALRGADSDNAPEGIHRDGADYILSAFVVARHRVRGGTSIVYDVDAHTKLLSVTLESGYGIVQDDTWLWHDVTPVSSALEDIGYRDIFGIDLTHGGCA